MKRVAILGTSGGTCFAARGFDAALSDIGLNTGNAMFQHALWERIQNPKVRVTLATNVDFVRDVADVLVIPAANQIYPGFDLTAWARFVEAVDLPCVVLGLGAQAPISAASQIELPGSVVRFARAISERATQLGVRGEFTRQVLEHIGVNNTVITGCPSQMINLGVTGRHVQAQIDALQYNPPERLAVLAGTMQGDTHIAERALWNAAQSSLDHIVVFQMVPHVLRFLLDGQITAQVTGVLSQLGKVVRPDLTNEAFVKYLRKHGRFFSDARSWIDAMAAFDAAIGMRIHGAVAAIQAGRLGVCMAFDSRTLELAETMGYPRIIASEIQEGMGIKDILNCIIFDQDHFDKMKEENIRNMWNIMTESNLTVSFPPPSSVSNDDFLNYIRIQFQNLEKRPSGIPDDFDPYYYLMKNPDILQARVNPYSHYLEWGKKENRSYRPN